MLISKEVFYIILFYFIFICIHIVSCGTTKKVVQEEVVQKVYKSSPTIPKKKSFIIIHNNTNCSKRVKVYQKKKVIANLGWMRKKSSKKIKILKEGRCGFYIEDASNCGEIVQYQDPIERYSCKKGAYKFFLKNKKIIKIKGGA